MPVLGEFRYAPMQENGVYQVRVPRQEDNSLELVMLEIPDQVGYDCEEIPGQVGDDGERAGDDGERAGDDGERVGDDGERVVVDRLPLGEYIARSGYDWTAEDLADVNFALDLEIQQMDVDDARVARRDAILRVFTPEVSAGTYAYSNFGRSVGFRI